jgi:colanic acid biosynthesis glycosyl transferase WcaI
MRILYLSQYFPPEAGATQSRAYEMAHNWISLGHSVTMITEFPNHPSGIMPKEYRGRKYERVKLDGIDVVRVWVYTSPVKNFRNRMLFYLSFMLNAILAGIFIARGKYDMLYATSPPLFVGGAGLVLRFIKHISMVFEVRDLWPASAVELGELKNSHAISLATRLENACYQRAVRIVVATRGIQNYLEQRGIPPEKIIVIPNGANISMFTFLSEERTRIRKEFNLEHKFVAIYAGIHGVAQGLENIVEAAEQLKDDKRVHFILIGDGPKKADILSMVKEHALPNFSLLPEQPREKIPGFLSASDVALVPLKDIELFKGVLPSKLFDAWACERPVLISIDGEARHLVECVHGGKYIPPESSQEMAAALLEMMRNSDELEIMGKNGQKYTAENHSRQTLAKVLISNLENIITEKITS